VLGTAERRWQLFVVVVEAEAASGTASSRLAEEDWRELAAAGIGVVAERAVAASIASKDRTGYRLYSACHRTAQTAYRCCRSRLAAETRAAE
jgi:ornithine cyclodeaminase/alanine dehydrogenase-like protein (mu-crystallin family)